MCKRISLYLVLVIVTIVTSFLYHHEILIGFLCLQLIYPVFSFLQFFGIKRKIRAQFHGIIPIVEKKKGCDIAIKITNQLKFLRPKIIILLSIKEQMSNKSKTLLLDTILDRAGEKNIVYQMSSEYCGNIVITLKEIRVYDSLGIFYRTLKDNQKVTIGVLPPYHLLLCEVSRNTREFLADSEEYSENRPGDDPSETHQIRKYRPGDSLHSIHWKLTAKENELMVREYGFPLGCGVLIWIDLTKEKKVTRIDVDRLLEISASLSYTLMEAKVPHLVAWFEPDSQRIVKKQIIKEDQVFELLNRLLIVESYEKKSYNPSYFEEAFRNQNFSSIVKINLKGNIIINKEEQAKISKKNIEEELEKFVLSI